MFGSLILLILVNLIVILNYVGGWQLPKGQKPPYGPPETKNLPYICTLPAEEGRCEAVIKRWYYSIKSGQCESFYYGGCEGNPNNFGSLKQCRQCCPVYTSNVCPIVNITLCQKAVNSVTKQCLGGSQITVCGTACPLICGEPPAQFCTANCGVGPCRCPPDYYRRISDCQCVKPECCFTEGSSKIYGDGQYALCP